MEPLYHFSTFFFLLFLPIFGSAQIRGSCPVNFLEFNPAGVKLRIENASGKTIVGMVFYAALSDATEHWKWYHYNFDDTRDLRKFQWNKRIGPSQKTTLLWDREDIAFDHGGGAAMVLSSVLFEDGSSWEAASDTSVCKALWYHHDKKGFTKPVELPVRP